MYKTYLDKIIYLTESPLPRELVILDCCGISGHGLLWTFIKSHIKLGSIINYFSCHVDRNEVKTQYLNLNGNEEQLHLYDFYSDPCGWNGSGNPSLADPIEQCLKCTDAESNEANQEEVKHNVVIIDKIEDIIRYQSPSQLIKSLNLIRNKSSITQLMICCGEDVITSSVKLALCHMAAVTIQLRPTLPKVSCNFLFKKLSGKVIKNCEEFILNPDLLLEDIRLVTKTSNDDPSNSSDTDAMLVAHTTFNLTLTHQQRQAKNKLLLPHTRVQASGGNIHYTFDDADDWDDDDPDEDLDI